MSDSHYGLTLDIYACRACGLLFCPDAGNVTRYYEALEDRAYEDTRVERSLQARGILRVIKSYQPAGTLLDVGAGSGILVEQATAAHYDASGIEPSEWAAALAQARGLAVFHGTFPRAAPRPTYDVITLIDVVEHVSTPVPLLRDVAAHLSARGIAVVVTPDVASIAARVMGANWWHYRVAHIGYFGKATLTAALELAQLQPIAWHRPVWFFPLDYLLSRLARYVPLIDRVIPARLAHSVTVRLNLRDSWMVIAKKANS
jgi:SAM-dependent methyltransferase